jgi:hypothetical protein
MDTVSSLPSRRQLSAYSYIKEGMLSKRSDHLGQWNLRYFTLDDAFLHYYHHVDDPLPRRSLQILPGVTVLSVNSSAECAGHEGYHFLVSLPESSLVYYLSASSQAERESWIRGLHKLIESGQKRSQVRQERSEASEEQQGQEEQQLASPGRNPRTLSPPLVSDDPEEEVKKDKSEEETLKRMDLSEINRNCSTELSEHLSTRWKQLTDSLLSTKHSLDWKYYFESETIFGSCDEQQSSTSPSSISEQCGRARVERVLPYHLPEIFAILIQPNLQQAVCPEIETIARTFFVNKYCWCESHLLRSAWPLSLRRSWKLVTWSILESGVVMFQTENQPDFMREAITTAGIEAEEEEGVLHFTSPLEGYLLKPMNNGATRIVAHCAIEGSGEEKRAEIFKRKEQEINALVGVLEEMYGKRGKPSDTPMGVPSSRDTMLAGVPPSPPLLSSRPSPHLC